MSEVSLHPERSTEENILEAAKTVFTQKGYAATRMQEIADTAGINKAMLHYYFRSKDKLFRVIFLEALDLLAPVVLRVLKSDKPILGKVYDLIDAELEMNLSHPHLALFIMNELSQNPEGLREELRRRVGDQGMLKDFAHQMQTEIEAGKIRAYDPLHLIINTMSMCIMPFIAQPFLITMSGMADEQYRGFLETRAGVIKQFVGMALLP